MTDKWNTWEYRRLEWRLYNAVTEWKRANKSLKNPHELQNGLDIIFSINSILESNEKQLAELEKQVRGEEPKESSQLSARNPGADKKPSEPPKKAEEFLKEELQMQAGANRHVSDTNVLKSKSGSVYRTLIPRMMTIKRGFTITSASNSPSESQKSSDSPRVEDSSNSNGNKQTPTSSDQKSRTFAIHPLATRKEMESIAEFDESEEAVPSPGSAPRMDTETPLHGLNAPSRGDGTFKKFSLHTPPRDEPPIRKNQTSDFTASAAQAMPDGEATPTNPGWRVRRNNMIMNTPRRRRSINMSKLATVLPTPPSAFVPRYSPGEEPGPGARRQGSIGGDGSERSFAGNTSGNSLLSSSRYGSLSIETPHQATQPPDREFLDSLRSLKESLKGSREATPRRKDSLSSKIEDGNRKTDEATAVEDKLQTKETERPLMSAESKHSETVIKEEEEEQERISEAEKEFEGAEGTMDELDKKLEEMNASITGKLNNLKDELTSVREHRQTYVQFNVINNVSMKGTDK